MKSFSAKAVKTSLFFMLIGFMASSYGQSLTDKLAKDDSFYKNYGRESYSLITIQKDVVGLYDGFGEHITDGMFIYEMSNDAVLASSEQQNSKDSMLYATFNQYRKKEMYSQFQNLVITQDAIGGIKHTFLIGNQITTKFTPLTFNMTNFRGIRWDIWSSTLQLSMLIAPTRPGVLAKKDTDSRSLVSYPLSWGNLLPFPDGLGLRGGSQDYSALSPANDYDMLIAAHAQNNIANKVDVGVSYINHHVSNVKEGEKWLDGDVSGEWMPGHIHFEFYDGTPQDTSDAGVFVESIKMFVNDIEVVAKPQYNGKFQRVFVGDKDSILFPKELPIPKPQSGTIPIIVEFKVDPEFYQSVNSTQRTSVPLNIGDVKNVRFEYTCAGNYLVFVSSDRQIPLGIKGKADPQTGMINYDSVSKSVGDIYDNNLKVGSFPALASPNVGYERYYSTTYFGQYICQSPKFLPVSAAIFNDAYSRASRAASAATRLYNYRTYSYKYSINSSSVTYGIDFKGEIAGIKFNGELALNQNTSMWPGSASSKETVNKFVGNLHAERELGKFFGISADGYYISPQWQTNLEQFQTSRYFRYTYYKDGVTPDYLTYPLPFGSNWANIDDNDDGDAFPENNRRIYPSDLGPDSKGSFYEDGTNKWATTKALYLPDSRMYVPYDDPDGVVSSKNDRNKNSYPDYLEDFLLFSSDPPVFELGSDLNNNGIPDYEDDDMLPDFGHSVGYVVTSDGVKTQGIQGGSFNLRYTPFENTVIDAGTIIEGVVDHDLVLDPQSENGIDFLGDGASTTFYVTAKQDVIKRSQGIQYELGAEIRAIADAIRNDGVRSIYAGLNSYDYLYRTDPLDYRRAAVANFLGSVTYNNIRNFEYGFRARIGGEIHLAIPGQEFYTTYTLVDPSSNSLLYGYGEDAYVTKWEPYDDAKLANLHLVNRVSYKIKFKNDFSDWRQPLNLLNNLEITPQYKIQYSFEKEFSGVDPRDTAGSFEQHLRMDYDRDGVINFVKDGLNQPGLDTLVYNEKVKWIKYRAHNASYLLNVPIVKANYKIAENTSFQLGFQWLRYIDFLSPEAININTSVLGQIVSKAQYRGYQITLFLGFKSWSNNSDVNHRDPVLGMGSLFNTRGYEIFARIYSGI